jgi:hypothetical protein
MLICIGDVSTVAGFPVRKRICSAVLHVMLLLVCVALDHELRLMNALVRSRSGQRVGDQTIVTSPRRRSGTRDPSAAFSITQTARVMQFDRQKPCFFQRMKYHVRYGELLPAGLQNGDVLAVHLLVCESQCGVMPAPCVEPAPHTATGDKVRELLVLARKQGLCARRRVFFVVLPAAQIAASTCSPGTETSKT